MRTHHRGVVRRNPVQVLVAGELGYQDGEPATGRLPSLSAAAARWVRPASMRPVRKLLRLGGTGCRLYRRPPGDHSGCHRVGAHAHGVEVEMDLELVPQIAFGGGAPRSHPPRLPPGHDHHDGGAGEETGWSRRTSPEPPSRTEAGLEVGEECVRARHGRSLVLPASTCAWGVGGEGVPRTRRQGGVPRSARRPRSC